ncbi:MAG: hypothetical protein WC308_01275 [archaeon]|jgi:translation elongation factor EF-1beta
MRPFEILAYSIAALAILFVFYSLYQYYFPPQNVQKEISDALDLAQSPLYLGKTVQIGSRTMNEGSGIYKSAFEKEKRLVAIECNSEQVCCSLGEKCSGKINWSYETIEFKNSETINISARCITQEKLPVCRIYFGESPLQAKIKKILLVENVEGKAKINVTVRNENANPMGFGVNTIKLYKLVGTNWLETDKTFEAKEIEILEPKSDYNFEWEINITMPGSYKAVFRFESMNAGYDENSINFEVETGANCKADESAIAETTLILDSDPAQYKETHYCTGCIQAYECASAWEEKIGKGFEPLSPEQTYCIKDSYEGQC